jgi:hypothetical protein
MEKKFKKNSRKKQRGKGVGRNGWGTLRERVNRINLGTERTFLFSFNPIEISDRLQRGGLGGNRVGIKYKPRIEKNLFF